MGREGGGGLLKICKTEKEAKEFLENHKKQNSQMCRNYQGDRTDSGRGYACEDDGGFEYYSQYDRTDTIYDSKEKAEEALEKLAEDLCGSDDSEAVVLGRFRPVKESVQATIKEEENKHWKKLCNLRKKTDEALGKATYNKVDTIKVKSVGKSIIKIDKEDEFAQCLDCGSVINLSKMSHGYNDRGMCKVCSHSGKIDKSRKRERPLMSKDYEKQSKLINEESERLEKNFKKRKEDLTNKGLESKPEYIIVHSWISAHF